MINDANVVAFQANLKDGRTGGFTVKDGSITTVADNTNLSFDGFGEVCINNGGTVVFTASLGGGVDGIFTGNAETITTIADTSSPARAGCFVPQLMTAMKWFSVQY